jgi:hypothetical protein
MAVELAAAIRAGRARLSHRADEEQFVLRAVRESRAVGPLLNLPRRQEDVVQQR